MVPIGTEVILNQDILQEDDRKQNFFIYEKYINAKTAGKVKSHEPNGQIWVTFPGNHLLLWEHNIIPVN
ncbi:hypothetical protein SAMN05444008_102433 [Cnuella takakiae]|uniref:Uncharacterized protein n=1 Tax=Cnuella takakiae TaxID=1302690 RepID=A0A1M4VZI0_9BACT|nr:hypothetical protein [Cnuella takakiae]OLY92457.1 hypothetical protein BUE76_11590 [Cnuella takakiae]SHE74305.1 hypothetical protein SAMN05444008_102433 [Cnuella takakiae]